MYAQSVRSSLVCSTSASVVRLSHCGTGLRRYVQKWNVRVYGLDTFLLGQERQRVRSAIHKFDSLLDFNAEMVIIAKFWEMAPELCDDAKNHSP